MGSFRSEDRNIGHPIPPVGGQVRQTPHTFSRTTVRVSSSAVQRHDEKSVWEFHSVWEFQAVRKHPCSALVPTYLSFFCTEARTARRIAHGGVGVRLENGRPYQKSETLRRHARPSLERAKSRQNLQSIARQFDPEGFEQSAAFDLAAEFPLPASGGRSIGNASVDFARKA